MFHSPGALTFGYGCTVHVGVDVRGRRCRGRRNLYNIHHERPIHRVLGTVQRQGTTTSGQLKYRVQYKIG